MHVSRIQKWKFGSSALALIAMTAAAAAQPAPADEQPVEQVTVTGTNLRGVVPVGSSVITVDQEQIQKTAPANVQQLLTTVPALTSAGSIPQGEGAGGAAYSPNIHQLGSSASNSTLVVVDGLRLPGAGTQGYVQSDPNMIPTIAIQRVEVLADGASSIYGSDAVAGVVNFITRKSYEGLELDGQGGVADGYSTFNLGLLTGHRWDSGSVMLAAGYSFQSDLKTNSRTFMSLGDFTSLGGNNNNVFGCPTAAMQVPGTTGVFLSPSSASAVSTAAHGAQNCNTWQYGAWLPQSARTTAMMRINQDFGSRLSTSIMLDVNDLNTKQAQGPGSVSNVTVYGPGSGKGGQINPFYTNPAGAPAATQQTITWVDLMGNGPTGNNFGYVQTGENAMFGHATATYKLTDNWIIDIFNNTGYDHSFARNINTFCNACALLALNGTAQTSGSTTATDISGQNVIALNTPLTTANALDVWNPAGSTNRTSAATNLNLYRGRYGADDYNFHNQLRGQISGSLFDLPAGPVKVALGGELLAYHLTHEVSSPNGTSQVFQAQQHLAFNYHRTVKSAYAEINIPLVSPEMGIPLIRKLTANISGRYDDFSDVGQAANPKFAATWDVSESLSLRANYSSSFVAPPMGVLGDPSLGGQYNANGASVLSGLASIPVSVYPNVKQLPGCATATTVCNIPTTDQGLQRQLGGTVNNIKPETGNSWSVGADFHPEFLPGLNGSVTLFNNSFKGGITTPALSLITNTPAYQNRLTICPTGCTATQIADFTRVSQGALFQGTLPSTVYFLYNHDESNVIFLKIQGLDFAVNYDWDWDGIGHIHVGDTSTVFTQYDQCPPTGASGSCYSVLNTSGLNQTFPSIQQYHRANLSWSDDIWSADLFINYRPGFRYVGSNAGTSPVHPIVTDPATGNFAGGGDSVKTSVTLDTHIAYNFPDGLLGGDQIYLDIKNLLDSDPPFENSSVNGANIAGGFGFDRFTGNPLGRITSVGFRANL